MAKEHKWALFQELGRWVIRRWENGKYRRHPQRQYRHIRDNEPELIQYLMRLNASQSVREAVELKHAYISPALLDKYLQERLIQVPNTKNVMRDFRALKKHFLNFFIVTRGLNNPVDWLQEHRTTWAQYLLGPDVPPSADVKKRIVQSANKFMEWLHRQRPETPLLKFLPLDLDRLKGVEADRVLNNTKHSTQYVAKEDWKTIQDCLPKDILACAELAYLFGLRRAETLGLKDEDVRPSCLLVARQLKDTAPTYAILKGKEPRKVPYWFADAYKVLDLLSLRKLMHPDTLGDRWAKEMKELGFNYTFHDLRHSWVTNALRTQNPRDVQLAAGHVNIETTMEYSHDDRGLELGAPVVRRASVAQK